MIHLRLARCLGLPVPSLAWTYGLACERIDCDVPLAALDAYRLPGSGPLPPTEPFPVPSGACDAERRSVRGWIGGETRKVVCIAGAAGFDIHVSGIGRFAVSVPDGHIWCMSLETGLSRARARLEEVLLGPALVLSLACRDVWCLHASAVSLSGSTVLFLGASGQGKSTLAGYCAGRSGLERVADDILPCSLVDEVACAKPHFPQLKLPPLAQYPKQATCCLPVDALIFIDPTPGGQDVEIETVPPIDAVKRLAETTVAVSLFDSALHWRHLRFLASVLASVPVFALRYSHSYAQLPAVCDAVAKQSLLLHQTGGSVSGSANAAKRK